MELSRQEAHYLVKMGKKILISLYVKLAKNATFVVLELFDLA